jgi:hypothetical protein
VRSLFALFVIAAVAAAQPTATDVLTDAPPVPAKPEPVANLQQQHWVAFNLLAIQPTAARVQVKVWDRPQNSLWIEAFGGAAIASGMYGFGVRMQHTASGGRNGDALFFSPGAGMHIIPNYTAYYGRYETTSWGGWSLFGNSNGATAYSYYHRKKNSLAFIALDADISWVHDFDDHFAFELGCKIGVAFKVKGDIGEDRPGLMFSDSVYPIIAFYSGFRF